METPPSDALNELASAWFARLRSADLSSEERDVFDRWMDVPRNAVAYARVEAAWDRAERLQAGPASGVVRRQSQALAQPAEHTRRR